MRKILSVCFILFGLIICTGCQKSQTEGIYNEWLCTNRYGPRFVINENEASYQYNDQKHLDVNYLAGSNVSIKTGEQAASELREVSNDGATEYLSNPEHIYSVKFYFTTYINGDGIDQSQIIQDGESWWYAFKLIGNGRAHVININTGEEFYCEVVK